MKKPFCVFLLFFLMLTTCFCRPVLAHWNSDSPALNHSFGGGLSLAGGFVALGAVDYAPIVIPIFSPITGMLRAIVSNRVQLDIKLNLSFFPLVDISLGFVPNYYWLIGDSRFLLGLGFEIGYATRTYIRIPCLLGYELLFNHRQTGIQFAVQPFFDFSPSTNPFLFGFGAAFTVSFYFYRLKRNPL